MKITNQQQCISPTHPVKLLYRPVYPEAQTQIGLELWTWHMALSPQNTSSHGSIGIK